ncbi:redox-regulated ATPase YchF [Candidatus Atribacteria bacterium MT.SAG.1]|nr:redox-regulated ATPase YchF [Candidatus Atribacteria bacterium MT.SAG.1]
MKIAIVGMPLTGKTTLFNLLTGQHKETSAYSLKGTKNIGIATVYDKRIKYLSSLYHPKKTTYAAIEFVDIGGISPELRTKEKVEIFSLIQDTEALLFVIRLFEDPAVAGEKNPIVQIENLKCELLLRDLEVVENRLERLKKSKKKLTHEELVEMEILKKCNQGLNDDQFLSNLEFSEDEMKKISGFSFHTLKPIIIVLNLNEEQFKTKTYSQKEKLDRVIQDGNMASLNICGKMEMEISQLAADERQMFLEDLGLKESGIERLSRVCYKHLGLISFFTVGEDEVKAWTIKKDIVAKKAAGKVHSDIERGFIRAEIARYQDLVTLGSMHAIKEKGLLKIEGKDAIIEDGDIINFRFNV